MRASLFITSILSCSCYLVNASRYRYVKPEWWDRISSEDTTGFLRTCRGKVKWGNIPSDGKRCWRRNKICYFGTQYCGADSVGPHPMKKCECTSHRLWNCQAETCPGPTTTTSCDTIDTCGDCLDSEECGYWQPADGGRCDSTCRIAETSCYSQRTFPDLTTDQTCQEVANDVADAALCSGLSDSGCDGCVGAVLSDRTTTCQWIVPEFGGNGFCASSCGMEGCGVTTCPVVQPGCGSQADCTGGQICFDEDDNFCGICTRYPPSCLSDADCPGGQNGGGDLGGGGDFCDDRKIKCLCNGSGPTCNPACSTDSDCALGDTCLSDGHCTPTTCTSDANCIDHFACVTGGTCARRTCTTDLNCSTDAGFCVKGSCFAERGFCSFLPP